MILDLNGEVICSSFDHYTLEPLEISQSRLGRETYALHRIKLDVRINEAFKGRPVS